MGVLVGTDASGRETENGQDPHRPASAPEAASILLNAGMLHTAWTGLRCAPLFFLAAFALPAAGQPVVDYLPAKDAAIVDAKLPDARVLPGGIRFREHVAGKGPLIRKGDRVNALYVGRLINGEIFNQKRSRLHSFRFEVGAQPRQIIRGWEVALLHMQEGGTYHLAIPSEFGYRDHGRTGQVPPYATLLFEIEILEVVRSGGSE